MNSDSVSIAFQLILEEIDAVISDVNSQGAAFFRNSDYVKVAECRDSGEKLKFFREKLDALRNEWSSGLDEPTKQKLHVPFTQVVKGMGGPVRASRTLLVVKFKDGLVLYENRAADTFVKALKKIGFERIIPLGLKVCGFPLISRQKCENYPQMEMDGYLVMTHSSTEAKRDKLIEIATAVEVDISVDIVPKKETHQVAT